MPGRRHRGTASTDVARSALLYATTPAADGGAAALLGPPERPALRRLLDQLAAVDVPGARIVVRPDWLEAVHTAAEGAPLDVAGLAPPAPPGGLPLPPGGAPPRGGRPPLPPPGAHA